MHNMITEYEFGMLKGTELIVSLIKNRIQIESTPENINIVLSYLEQHATGLYHLRQNGNSVTVYCENAFDIRYLDTLMANNT